MRAARQEKAVSRSHTRRTCALTTLLMERIMTMRILYINNDGGGFADYLNVPEGQTVEQFFAEQMPGREPHDYLIRVNRQPVPCDYVLQENDRVTLTPTKIEGAM